MITVRAALHVLGEKGQENHQERHNFSVRSIPKRQTTTAKREAVSRAMKKYWAKRKAAEAKGSQKVSAKAA